MTFNNVYLFDGSNGFLQTIGDIYVDDGAVYRSKSNIWIHVTRLSGGLTAGRAMQLYVNNTSVSGSFFQISTEL